MSETNKKSAYEEAVDKDGKLHLRARPGPMRPKTPERLDAKQQLAKARDKALDKLSGKVREYMQRKSKKELEEYEREQERLKKSDKRAQILNGVLNKREDLREERERGLRQMRAGLTREAQLQEEAAAAAAEVEAQQKQRRMSMPEADKAGDLAAADAKLQKARRRLADFQKSQAKHLGIDEETPAEEAKRIAEMNSSVLTAGSLTDFLEKERAAELTGERDDSESGATGDNSRRASLPALLDEAAIRESHNYVEKLMGLSTSSLRPKVSTDVLQREAESLAELDQPVQRLAAPTSGSGASRPRDAELAEAAAATHANDCEAITATGGSMRRRDSFSVRLGLAKANSIDEKMLFAACNSGHVPSLTKCLRDANEGARQIRTLTDTNGRTALDVLCACAPSRDAIASRASVTSTPAGALQQASTSAMTRMDSFVECVRMVLQHGADPCSSIRQREPQSTKKDPNKGMCALHHASYRGAAGSLQVLLQHISSAGYKPLLAAGGQAQPSPVDARADDSVTPLMLAAASAWCTCTQLLLDAGAAVNAVDAGGRSALHYSARSSYKTTKLLLEAGCTVEMQDKQGQTAQQAAAAAGQNRTAQLLAKWGTSKVAMSATISGSGGRRGSTLAKALRSRERRASNMAASALDDMRRVARATIETKVAPASVPAGGRTNDAEGLQQVDDHIQEHWDEEHGCPYFIDTQTGQTAWVKQELLQAGSDEHQQLHEQGATQGNAEDEIVDCVSQHYDNAGNIYYYNALTHQSSYNWEEVVPRPQVEDEQDAAGSETVASSGAAPWALLARRRSFFKGVINDPNRAKAEPDENSTVSGNGADTGDWTDVAPVEFEEEGDDDDVQVHASGDAATADSSVSIEAATES